MPIERNAVTQPETAKNEHTRQVSDQPKPLRQKSQEKQTPSGHSKSQVSTSVRYGAVPKSDRPQPSKAHAPPPPCPRSPAHTDILSLIINSAAAVHTYTVAARAPLQHNVLRDGWPQRQTAPPPSDRGDSRSDETPNTARIARPDARHGAPRTLRRDAQHGALRMPDEALDTARLARPGAQHGAPPLTRLARRRRAAAAASRATRGVP